MDKLITITKAAEMLGCGTSKIYALAAAGVFELKKIGYRATRVSEISVLQYMNDPSIVKQAPGARGGGHLRLRVPEAAKYLGVTTHKLYHMRSKREGPAFIKIGHQILYDTRDLDSWLESHKTPTRAVVNG